MTTLMLTVPFSGTNFYGHFLGGCLGLDGRNYLVGPESSADFCHVHANKAQEINLDYYDAVIITLRHPVLSARTVKRGKAPNVKIIVDAWEGLVDAADKADKVIFLPIDCPVDDRLPQLQNLADHFEKSHMTDAIKNYADKWERISSSVSEVERELLYRAVERFEEWRQ